MDPNPVGFETFGLVDPDLEPDTTLIMFRLNSLFNSTPQRLQYRT
jgi:hypothetical protein